MKKKMNLRLLSLSAIAIFTTTVLVILIFYNLFLEQIKEELKTYAKLLQRMELNVEFFENNELELNDGVRVTLIEEKGKVLYDTKANFVAMGNHINRKEIQEAITYGEGFATRKSETIGMNTFYYAIKQSDGSFLRIAKESASVGSIIMNVIPTLVIALCALFILTIVVSDRITRSFIQPIESLADSLDTPNTTEIYEELIPFVRRIQSQHEDILRSSLVRQEFTANVSHELKTPLAAISGYAELIETGMASMEDVQRFAQGIHKSANRLLNLINDIIRLSELDIKPRELELENIDLYEAAKCCIDTLSINGLKNQVVIELKGRETKIYSNKQMIDEVLYNLIGNAIRYNKENGKVIVTISPCGDKGMLVVEDTGIGIPKDHQERIFERFYRVDKGRSKASGGTGLGLAIVKHIIQSLNATLDLESQEEIGTKITIFL